MSILKSYFDVPESSAEMICGKDQTILKRESIVLSDDRMDCLIPIKIDRLLFGRKRILYDLTGTVSLADYLPNVIFSKRLFIRLIRNIIQSYKNIRHLKFDTVNLIYSVDRLFIDTRNWKISFIYVVAGPYYGSDNIMALLKDVACSCIFDSSENISFVSDFFSMLESSHTVFDVDQFLNYLEDESNIFEGNASHCSSCGAPIGSKDTVCPLCGRSVGRRNEKNIFAQKQTVAKAYLDDGMRKIPINEFPFSIGKNESNSMVIPYSKISRLHAQIGTDGTGFYIVDLNSTNGTYINGERIVPGKKIKLNDGTGVEFVDEKYVFVLK